METINVSATTAVWILKFRGFTIRDLKLGVRSKDAAKSALRFFTEKGCIIPVRPEWEWPLMQALVKSHPDNKRDFEHFLTKTRSGILPSEVLNDLRDRSDKIPTLAIVRMLKGEVEEIVKVEDANDLYNLQKEIEAV